MWTLLHLPHMGRYEMLSGRVPFLGATHEELVANALALNYDTRPDLISVGAVALSICPTSVLDWCPPMLSRGLLMCAGGRAPTD